MYAIKLDDAKFRARLDAWRGKLEPAKIADIGGRYMALTHLPGMFDEGGPGWAKVARGGSPLWDVGTLAKSFFWRVVGTQAEIMNRQKYAITHDKGLTITAKTAYASIPGGPYLHIPLPALSVSERRTGKVDKGEGTFVAKSRNGNWIVFRKSGKDIEPIYLLRKSVKIIQRRFMFWSRAAIDGTIETIQEAVSIEKAA